ncbi:Txe/YoeB family addiction module toxin [Phormidium tenue]|uniref:Toxin YoeB n=1 Tax=Phormidium tenue NIES-30 TaxID=549789 RepID=A0A1U7JAI5_9CYAN|nr:Txe/YoeB family addiction module toxin [Phormidium tenue]MBD2230535.1 Txe/YoeB family addiction module toxin [Phormidium tenue FACHB-1052]OKH50689.1 toxin YoeB [Phormidium tenue NIES-30]
MRLIFAANAWEDYLYWQKSDRKILNRINTLIKDIQRQPFEGIGKPEPLKHGLSGYWSRRITDEHRMVYKVEDDSILIAQLRYHY